MGVLERELVSAREETIDYQDREKDAKDKVDKAIARAEQLENEARNIEREISTQRQAVGAVGRRRQREDSPPGVGQPPPAGAHRRGAGPGAAHDAGQQGADAAVGRSAQQGAPLRGRAGLAEESAGQGAEAVAGAAEPPGWLCGEREACVSEVWLFSQRELIEKIEK